MRGGGAGRRLAVAAVAAAAVAVLGGATAAGDAAWRGAKSPWATLGLPETGVPAEEVKRAFRDLALRHHPDKGGDPALFVALRAAFDELSTEEGRRRWLPGGAHGGRGTGGEGAAFEAWEDVLGDLVFRAQGAEGRIPREVWEQYAADPGGMFEGLFGGGQRLSVGFVNAAGETYATQEFVGRVRSGAAGRGRLQRGGAGLEELGGGFAGPGGLRESAGAQSPKRGQSVKFRFKEGKDPRSRKNRAGGDGGGDL